MNENNVIFCKEENLPRLFLLEIELLGGEALQAGVHSWWLQCRTTIDCFVLTTIE